MEKVRVLPLFFCCCTGLLFGQNLVPNPSFEDILDTLDHFTEDDVEFSQSVAAWTTPNLASPDLITPVFSERFITPPAPRTGAMMIGMQCGESWSECIGVKLLEDLVPGRTYYFEYWIRRAQCLRPAMDTNQAMNEDYGILLSPDPIKATSGKMLFATPQVPADTSTLVTDQDWVQISGYHTPNQSYSYLYLGQFRQTGQPVQKMSGYFVVDDLVVRPVGGLESLQEGLALPVGSIIPLQNVQFVSGTTELQNEESRQSLEAVVDYLRSNSAIRVRINGHTDALGNDQANMSLSKKRAKAIVQYLEEHGIEKSRLDWKGFGEKRPIADNQSAAGRAENRRVEFEVIE